VQADFKFLGNHVFSFWLATEIQMYMETNAVYSIGLFV
jgi:hypothetical protein